jgi:hypothetical protein
LAEGGFAVEVVEGTETTLTRVELIDVLDGRAAVEAQLAEGAEVVVPS